MNGERGINIGPGEKLDQRGNGIYSKRENPQRDRDSKDKCAHLCSHAEIEYKCCIDSVLSKLHDVNNRLTALMGNTELLKESYPQFFDGDALDDFLNQLLEISQLISQFMSLVLDIRSSIEEEVSEPEKVYAYIRSELRKIQEGAEDKEDSKWSTKIFDQYLDKLYGRFFETFNVFLKEKIRVGDKSQVDLQEELNRIQDNFRAIFEKISEEEESLKKTYSIAELVSESVTRTRGNFQKKGLQISVEFTTRQEELRAQILVKKMTEVIDELLKNAHDHLPEVGGEIKIIVSRTTENKNIEYIQIAVEDNGEGVDDSIKNKVFQKGFSTKRYGLGLYNAWKVITRDHGGLIQVLDNPSGKGARFELSFPAC